MDLSHLGAWLGDYGAWVAVILILVRSNLAKDQTIENLSSQAMRMAEANSRVVDKVAG